MEHYGDKSVYEDIEPSSGWIEDTENHYLLIYLPGIHTSFSAFQKKICYFSYHFDYNLQIFESH